jgi:hypothetical protein
MLTEILERAVDANAETVVLEYATGGLEVSYMFRNTGIGEILHDRALVEAIMACAWDKAKQARRSRGAFHLTLRSREHRILIRQYDSFGEAAFELRLSKPRR